MYYLVTFAFCSHNVITKQTKHICASSILLLKINITQKQTVNDVKKKGVMNYSPGGTRNKTTKTKIKQNERNGLTMKRRLSAILLAFALTLTVCTARVYSQAAETAETDSPETTIQIPDDDSLDLSDDIPESSVTDTVNEKSPNDSEDTAEESAAETEPSASENESSDDVVETDGTEEADEAEEAENAVPTDAEIEEDEQEAALRNAAPPTVTDEYCVLSGDALGNTYHRLTKTQVAENGFTYIKLTPTSDSLIPKVDRYSLNIGMGEYSFMKVLYKTTYADGVLSFNMISGVNLSGVYTFAPPETDKWIGAIIPISTNPDSVLKQYHFSVFGDAKANELEDEEFCLGYIGFFKDFDTAHSYMNELSEIDDSVESIDNVVIRGEELCGIAFDPDGVLEFDEEPQDGALKMTFTRISNVGKAEIDTTKLVRKYLDKSKFGYVAVRYKYNFTDPSRTYTSSLREGYSASATNHSLFVLPKNKNGEWITGVAGIEWGSADGAGNILTFHPIRGGDNAEIGDYLLLDYIGFFKSEADALSYGAPQTEATLEVKLYNDNSVDVTLTENGLTESIENMVHSNVTLDSYMNIIACETLPLIGTVVVFSGLRGAKYYTLQTELPDFLDVPNRIWDSCIVKEATALYITLEFTR